jgi:opacity protein-like surface antigen
VATSACTVRPHHVLVENGWSNTITTGPGGGPSTSYTQTFIHFGTWNPRLEFGVTPPSWNRSTAGGVVIDGTSDANFGAKYELGYNEKAVWAVNGQVSVPSGDPGFTSGAMQYTGNFDWTYTLNSEYGLAGTLSFNSLTGFDANNNVRRFSAFIPAVVLTAGSPANAQAFVEYAYFSHAGLGLPGKTLFDLGLVRDFTPNVFVDVEYGYSPTSINGQKQHYVGFGLSFMN